jgi:hypothetical protein
MWMTVDITTLVVVAGSIVLAVYGIWKIVQARRRHRAGVDSNPTYHAHLALGIYAIVFVPCTTLAVQQFGYFAGLAVVLIALVVVVWADDTLKNSGVQN